MVSPDWYSAPVEDERNRGDRSSHVSVLRRSAYERLYWGSIFNSFGLWQESVEDVLCLATYEHTVIGSV